VEGLGGAQKILDVNYYKHCHASLCLVLPPVGSARSEDCLCPFQKVHPAASFGSMFAILRVLGMFVAFAIPVRIAARIRHS
jgi:hypothetical protein